jgi:hypothetical protein
VTFSLKLSSSPLVQVSERERVDRNNIHLAYVEVSANGATWTMCPEWTPCKLASPRGFEPRLPP